MEIRDLDPDDLDQALDIRNRSFRPLAESRWDSWRQMMGRALADRRVLGCYDGARLVGTTRINRYRQWWQGQSLPMAGISGVVVAPEYRGRGVARQLMQATLERAAGLGYPISVLYPATVSLYRDRGWEIGGAQHLVTLPTAALRRLIAQPVPLRRAGPDDAGEVLSVVRQVHAATRVCGPYLQEEIEVRNRIENDQPFTYLAEDGFLAYRWDGGDLVVDEIVAGSGETARTLWSVVGSGSSTAATVRASVGPTDPLYWLVGEAVVQPAAEYRWMLRVVDVPTALSGRGYPLGVAAEVVLDVVDQHRPANSGAWRLRVEGGTGQVVRDATAGPAAPRLGPRGLAALFAGMPLTTLRTAGLLSGGDPGHDPVLEAVFTAQPYLTAYF